MPFYPGPGLGGHCIPIDPFYLSWKARQHGLEARFIELAGHVNGAMPRYVVERIMEALNTRWQALRGASIDAGIDCAVITTAHAGIDYAEVARRAPLVVDTRNALRGIEGTHIFRL